MQSNSCYRGIGLTYGYHEQYVVKILQFQQRQGPLCKNAGGACAPFASLVPTPLHIDGNSCNVALCRLYFVISLHEFSQKNYHICIQLQIFEVCKFRGCFNFNIFEMICTTITRPYRFVSKCVVHVTLSLTCYL